jgi:signal transduction histidine kinase
VPNELRAVRPGAALLPEPERAEERTRPLAVGRVAAAVLVATELALFVWAIPSRYRELLALAEAADMRAVRPAGYAAGVLTLEILVVASLTTVSALIVWRRTWSAPALLFACVFVGYAVWVTPTLDALPLGRSWPVGSLVQATGQWLAIAFFLTFPDGRFVPRWVVPVAAAWVAYAFAWAVVPEARISLIDPFTATVGAAALLLVGGWFVGLGAQYVRYRGHADEDQRRQTKVVMLVIAAACLGYAAVYVPGILIQTPRAQTLYELTAVPAFWLFVLPIPIALAAAMLRHRLFGASVVVVRAIVFGTLAVFITAVYIAIVVGIGTVVSGTAGPSLGLSLAATAIIAVAFQPMRVRAQRLANQVVYGRRASPYEVLATFASHVGEIQATQDLLPVTARNLGEGTGAESADVWLRAGDELRVDAVWPEGSSPHGDPLPVVDAERGPDGVDAFLPVRDRGEVLGALSIRMPPGERLTPAVEALAGQLASQAGLVLRNVRLTQDLVRSLEELRASRARIVAATDAERRRLERNIHDGAQQQLVALAVRAGLIRSQLHDPAAAGAALEQLQEQIQETLEDLRDLARGVFPPLLVDRGPVAALEGQARRSPVPVEIDADGVGRFAPEAEVAVYFCALEALQNVAKYAEATRVRIVLSPVGGRIAFEIVDDGRGFDPATATTGTGLQNMADRVSALGGEVAVDSHPGAGTRVHGWVPA